MMLKYNSLSISGMLLSLVVIFALLKEIDCKKNHNLPARFETSLPTVEEYYATIDFNAENEELKQQLHDLINPHLVYDYDEVWTAFDDVDTHLLNYPCNPSNLSYIPDVYSAYCWDVEKLSSGVSGGQCGNYKKEGDCYNREHLWPKSWFGGFDYGANAQTDLFELWPTDGYVNGLRGDLPFGEISEAEEEGGQVTYRSSNNCLIGYCNITSSSPPANPDDSSPAQYSGKCFEPTPDYKGDFARSYFYLSVAYLNEWSCCETEATNLSSIHRWMEDILRKWHQDDPVDDSERARNNDIYSNWQQNRNPFIDFPELVDQINDF